MTVEFEDQYELKISIVDNHNKTITDTNPYFNHYLESGYSTDEYYYFYPENMNAGKYKVEFTLDDGNYKAEPVTVNLNIVKAKFSGDIICKSYYGTDKTTLTMKATVENPFENKYEDGYVTFKVNGKSYKVKTKKWSCN